MQKIKLQNKITKFISAFLIISVLAPSILLSVPKQTSAQAGGVVSEPVLTSVETVTAGVTTEGVVAENTSASVAAKTWYEEVLDQVWKAVARKVLQEITKSTVTWINGGFHGSPLFLENPESFFTDIAKSEIKTLVDQWGYDTSKFPFGKDFAINTINNYKKTLNASTEYTFSKSINDPKILRNLQNDFNAGGWDAFIVNTQYPQNNYLGFQAVATEELARRLEGYSQNAVKEVKEVMDQGQGFLSPQICPSNQKYNNGSNEFKRPVFDEAKFNKENEIGKFGPPTREEYAAWNKKHDEAKKKWSEENTCPGGLTATTPGYVVGNQVSKALGVTQDETLVAIGAGDAISAVLGAVLDKFLQEGLTALSSTINPAPAKDTWTYRTLGLDGADGTNTDPFAGFDEVVVLKDFKILLFGKTVRTFLEGDPLVDEKGRPVMVLGEIRPGGTNMVQKFADGGETVTTFGDTRRINTIGKCLSDEGFEPNSSKANCDAKNGDWTDADNRKYFPGDIARTIEEIFLMDNSKITNASGSGSAALNPMGTCTGTDQIGSYNYQTTQEDCPGTWKRGSSTGGGTSSSSVSDFGILQFLKLIPKQTKDLDQCIPGPDKGWEDRLKSEQQRVSNVLVKQNSEEESLKAKASTDAVRELKFAVDAFKDWISATMLTSTNPPELADLSLPSSIIFIDEVKKIDDLPQTAQEVTDVVREKRQTKARLEVIGNGLIEITKKLDKNTKVDTDGKTVPDPLDEPKPNTAEERLLIQYWKQYKPLLPSISSFIGIENTRNQRVILAEWSSNLEDNLIPQCFAERRAKLWEDPDTTGKGIAALKPLADEKKEIKMWRIFSSREGNATASIIGGLTGGLVGSILGGILGTKEIKDINAEVTYTIKGTEVEQFCELPIINGYSHGEVIREDSSNELIRRADPNYTPTGCEDTRAPGGGSCDNSALTSQSACEAGSFTWTPNAPFVPDPELDCTGTGSGGTSTSGTGTFTGTGREKFTFRNQAASSDLPNAEQYAEGTNGYTTLPMVNAQYIYGDITTTGLASWGIGLGSSEDERVSIDISCNTVFKANITDYTHAGDPSF